METGVGWYVETLEVEGRIAAQGKEFAALPQAGGVTPLSIDGSERVVAVDELQFLAGGSIAFLEAGVYFVEVSRMSVVICYCGV